MPDKTLTISKRAVLITLDVVRISRGCDADSVLASVCDATRPHFLRWVFDVAARQGGRRELRFYKEEVCASVSKWGSPASVIQKILGERQNFPRAEIEVQWTLSAQSISRLVRAGELVEKHGKLTRASLAAFLERRLQ